jgi:hypothetical protein
LVRKPEGEIQFVRLVMIGRYMKMDVKEIGWERVVFIILAQATEKRQPIVKMVMTSRFPNSWGIS